TPSWLRHHFPDLRPEEYFCLNVPVDHALIELAKFVEPVSLARIQRLETDHTHFRSILEEDLLPQFCSTRPECRLSGFRWETVKIADVDAWDFAKAWKAGLLTEVSGGLYRAPRSSASEQFFW